MLYSKKIRFFFFLSLGFFCLLFLGVFTSFFSSPKEHAPSEEVPLKHSGFLRPSSSLAETKPLCQAKKLPSLSQQEGLIRQRAFLFPSFLEKAKNKDQTSPATSLQEGQVFSVSFFPDKTYQIEVAHLEQTAQGHSFLGKIAGEDFLSVTFAQEQGFMRLELMDTQNQKTYIASTPSPKVHTLHAPKPNPSGITSPSSPLSGKVEEYDLTQTASFYDAPPIIHALEENQEEDPRLPLTKEPVIHLLLIFDERAQSWVEQETGSLAVFAQSMINKLNLVSINSGATFSFKKAGIGVKSFVFPKNKQTSSSPILSLYNTIMTPKSEEDHTLSGQIYDWRNEMSADLISCMITKEKDPYLGISGLCTSTQGNPQAYLSVCDVFSSSTSYTFVHEIGHNLGAHHAKTQISSPGPNSFLKDSSGQKYEDSAAHYFTNFYNQFKCTVMAYPQDGRGKTATFAPFFSHPDKNFQGAPAGVKGEAHNIRAMNDCAPAVSLYKTEKKAS